MENLKMPKIETSIEELRALEKEDKYIFHGSVNLINEFEPRQAENINTETGKMENDGEPCISATDKLDIAIFRAVINNSIKDETGSHWSKFGVIDSEEGYQPFFSTRAEMYKKALESKGYVYVFKKDDFRPYNNYEYRSTAPIKPLRIFEVNFKDLPPNIRLEESVK